MHRSAALARRDGARAIVLLGGVQLAEAAEAAFRRAEAGHLHGRLVIAFQRKPPGPDLTETLFAVAPLGTSTGRRPSAAQAVEHQGHGSAGVAS